MRHAGPTGPTIRGYAPLVGLLGFVVVATVLPVRAGVPIPAVLLAWIVVLGIAVLEQQVAVYQTKAAASRDANSVEKLRLEVIDLAASLSVRPPAVTVLETDAPLVGVTALPGVADLLVSEGVLEAVDDDERRAILAHELAHVAGRDGVVTTAGAAVANATGIATFWAWALSWAPLRMQLVGVAVYQLCYLARSVTRLGLVTHVLAAFLPTVVVALVSAVSRRQEYRADAVASRCLGDPRPLVRGVRTLQLRSHTVDAPSTVRWESTATSAEESRLECVFATHPPFGRRADRLLEIDSEAT
ncbi:M48 family metallopeptidase [Natribaculum luteum]|uniref:M48 family metallopeptidase n=1 Tax=Natribaculum luteum TaxID=1586232 RepID=A0ABD5P435_9EURY|nr:M48 family metalloprotease [Natribaculum luteum]